MLDVSRESSVRSEREVPTDQTSYTYARLVLPAVSLRRIHSDFIFSPFRAQNGSIPIVRCRALFRTPERASSVAGVSTADIRSPCRCLALLRPHRRDRWSSRPLHSNTIVAIIVAAVPKRDNFWDTSIRTVYRSTNSSTQRRLRDRS